jgi:hypothetical protein
MGGHALAVDFYRQAFDFVNHPRRRDDYEEQDFYSSAGGKTATTRRFGLTDPTPQRPCRRSRTAMDNGPRSIDIRERFDADFHQHAWPRSEEWCAD